jgi:hypothetical protein
MNVNGATNYSQSPQSISQLKYPATIRSMKMGDTTMFLMAHGVGKYAVVKGQEIKSFSTRAEAEKYYNDIQTKGIST